MSDTSATAALIVAAGRGTRAGEGLPKQYRLLAGEPVLTRTLRVFLAERRVATIVVVIHADDEEAFAAAISGLATSDGRLRPPVVGAGTRQGSVRAGLESLAAAGFVGRVLIHDAARPFVDAGLIGRAIAAGESVVAAIPVVAVTDTIKRLDGAGRVLSTPDRAQLAAVQTPQIFALPALLAAHRAADRANANGFTDDAAIMEWAGHDVETFSGDAANLKLTLPQDFAMAEARLAGALVTRVGTGYDVHTFGPGDHVWLGGVRVAHDRGVVAHSDGDVVLHALTDALLGTLAAGDIGMHFPPSDPTWRGASSDRFLAFAAARVGAAGGTIDHLDVTIVCEAPKIGPHRVAIQDRIAAIAGLQPGQVGLKATTSERMGFTGRGEGLAALATATVRLPKGDDRA